MPTSSKHFVSLLTLVLLISGCGQKGPLYLPGDASTIRTTVPAQPGNGEEEEDEESEAPPTLRD
jgi:predicted small lipoprotein YifL